MALPTTKEGKVTKVDFFDLVIQSNGIEANVSTLQSLVATNVTTDTTQTITGTKTFDAPVTSRQFDVIESGSNASTSLFSNSVYGITDNATAENPAPTWAFGVNTRYWNGSSSISPASSIDFEAVSPGGDSRWRSNVPIYEGTNKLLSSATGVTLDTTQTITGFKTFSSTLSVGGNPSTAGIISRTADLTFMPTRWDGSASEEQYIYFGATATAEGTPFFSAEDDNGPLLKVERVAGQANLFEGFNRVYSAANPPPAPTNVVTTDTAQSISGVKTFSSGAILSSNVTAPSGLALSLRDSTSTVRLSARSNGITIGQLTSIDGGGVNVIGIADATTVPTTNPVAGAILYSESGVVKVRQSNGIIAVVGASPANMVTTDSAQTISAIKTFTAIPVVPDSSFTVSKINATGTRDGTTQLRGDGTWAPVAAPPIPFSYAGTVAVKSGVFKFPVSVACVVESVQITAGTASAGASIIADVNKNGTTIFTTQANRPTLAAGSVVATAGAAQVTSLAAGDYLTVDIDQVGSTTPGADVMVVVRIRRV